MAAAKSKSKTLITNVHVIHPETADIHHFRPGDEVPAWAVKAITNPNVWADDEQGDEPADPEA